MQSLENVIVAALILAATIAGSVYYIGEQLNDTRPPKAPVTIQPVVIKAQPQKQLVKDDQLRYQIRDILKRRQLPPDNDFLYHIAKVESDGGKHLVQMSGGPGRGYFQFERWVAKDVLKTLHMLIPSKGMLNHLLTYNLEYQVVLARRHLMRYSAPIPEDVVGQACLWAKLWNTEKGAGTISTFINKNRVDLKQ